MAPSPKPDHHLNLNHLPQLSATQPRSGSSTANTSPIEPPAGTAVRSPFGNPVTKGSMSAAAELEKFKPKRVSLQVSSTLASVRSIDMPDSPAQSSFSKEGLNDTDVKTLDYLGLAETPRQAQANLVQPGMQRLSVQPFLNDIAGLNRNLNRFRSYSVNAKEKYAEDDDDYPSNDGYSGQQSGVMTPMDAAIAQTNAQIMHHNLAVQAFASQASASRPRARTAGVLDSPLRTSTGPMRYLTRPQQINSPVLPIEWADDYEGLPEAVQALHLNGLNGRSTFESSDDNSQDVPTRALWLGNIPTSTTGTSLQAIFGLYGKIESSRVLMHKNCGFVNFEAMDSAIKAKSTLNGKEIFPGAGPVRIGYAKAPSSSVGGTPAHTLQSRSPDPYGNGQTDNEASHPTEHADGSHQVNGMHAQITGAVLEAPDLPESKSEMLQMANEFGASAEDRYTIEDSIDAAIAFQTFESEIPPIAEPSHSRVHDAPKLREIRKRIDNNAMTESDIENTALEMLPEISELASDYLGNTVVQKLFEFCSEPVKDQMLSQIAPHLAEVGVHKNGTWAAQKIIDVSKSQSQMQTIVDSIRPFTVALFLDQYGNYVLQGCLRFGYPYNNFIFETMLSPYLTVLKVINQRNELEARDIVLRALFSSEDDKTLADILSDQVSGATLIFKVLTTPVFDDNQRNDVIQTVRNVLLRLKVTPSQGYKRLMDEVGLSGKGGKSEREQTPNGRGPHQERNRTPQHGSRERRNHHHMDNERQFNNNQFFQPSPQQQYPMQTGFSGSSAMDPNGLLAYDQLASNYAPNQLNQLNQQYQPSLLQRGTSPADYYGLGGYAPPPTTMGQLPQQPMRISSSPMLQQSPFGPPGFNPLMGGNVMAGGYPMPMQYYPQQQHVMQQQDRRGRR
ncbi:protein JSN1, partial [Lecanoromycetidae sp. Uapishka_2]